MGTGVSQEDLRTAVDRDQWGVVSDDGAEAADCQGVDSLHQEQTASTRNVEEPVQILSLKLSHKLITKPSPDASSQCVKLREDN